jgi:diguanylate cyclase (GGDEF)-like protein
MLSRSTTALTALIFVSLSTIAAYLAGVKLTPFVLYLLASGLLFLWTEHAQRQERRTGAPLPALRALSLAFCAAITIATIAATGASQSPFVGVLFLPILLAAVSFGLSGSVVTGLFVSTAFLLLDLTHGRESLSESPALLVQVVTFLLVATAAGAFAKGMQQTVTETEAFLDTSVMMDSVYDLENTLAIALIRLADLVPCRVCAVFLRDPEGNSLQLALLTGMHADHVRVHALSLEETEADWRGAFGARRWPDVRQDRAGLGNLGGLDAEARDVIVAPLRTLDDFFGLIYVNAHDTGTFTERHRDLVDQFARHVVYPIQRVRLQALATTDVMTGLSNHRSFRRRLADEVRRAQRYEHVVSLILIDIDHFKRCNDTYGHPAGDALLAQLGAILRRSLRGIDIPARYGGEELVVICPETDAEDARALAERIRTIVEGNRFVLPEGGETRLTVSLGVATLPLHADGEAALVEAADQALYAAKAAGRNTVRAAPAPAAAALVA